MTRARYTRYTWPTLLFTRRDSRGSVLVQRSVGVVVIAVARAFCFDTRAVASFHTIRTISLGLGIAASSSLGAVGLTFFLCCCCAHVFVVFAGGDNANASGLATTTCSFGGGTLLLCLAAAVALLMPRK